MGRLEEQDFDEKRLARRRRRERSQLIAYIVLILILVLVIGAGTFGVIKIRGLLLGAKKDKPTNTESVVASTEESNAVIETPEETVIEPEEMSKDDVLMEIVNGCIRDMTLEDKVASLFVVTPEQLTGVENVVKAGDSTKDALAQYAIGGLSYSAKNIKSEEQISEMMNALEEMAKYPLFTIVRENGTENGAISSTMGKIDFSEIKDEESAYSAGGAVAAAMFRYGFNFDIATNMDITDNGQFGTDIENASLMSAAFIKGLCESGITACAYDFPVIADTSAGAVSSDANKEDLMMGSYSLFKNAIDNGELGAIMLSNVSLPEVVGDNTPVSLSGIMIGNELRKELGFDGIIITGPLNEKAVTDNYPADKAAVTALKAGADLLYLPEDFKAAYDSVLAAVSSGEISEDRINESLTRIFKFKYAEKVK